MQHKRRNLGWVAVLALLVVPGTSLGLVTLYGPTGMDWDIYDHQYGQIYDGESDAYDSCFMLDVNGTRYNTLGVAATAVYSGRGYRMAAVTIGTSLSVQRTVYVPDTGTNDFIRYYDTFENTGSSSVSVTALYTGDLGTDSYTEVTDSSNGDTIVDLTDTWYAVHDPRYAWTTPQAMVWWDGVGLAPTTLSLTSDDIRTQFEFTVPAGETYAIMFFAVQNTTVPGSQATAAHLVDMPDDAMVHLTSDEMMAIQNWQAGGAPIIRLATEDPLECEEGGTLDITVDVEDLEGDPFDVYWELTGDGAFDDGTGLTGTFNAVGWDGPDTAVVQVRAQDSSESRILDIDVEVINVPPVFVSDPAVDPGLQAYRGRTWIYHLEVEDPANADGITRDPVIVEVTDKPDAMIYFGDNHFEWTPREVDVGDHLLRITADDRDSDEPSVQEVTIEVMANAPPEAPVIVSPDATTVHVTQPTLIVENAEDMDGDMLSYTFEVATSGDFSDTSVVARGNVFEGTGDQTEWMVTTVLMDMTRYYWRVWANDGRNDGPSASTHFDVDTSGYIPDPSEDASTDVVDDTTPWVPPGDESGCGCRLAGSAKAGPLALLVLVVLAMVVRSRRKE